jgi:anti-sigma B factor antagonist
MEIKERKVGTMHIIQVLEPQLDYKNANEFEERMVTLINNGSHLIVLDLSEVVFVDSNGLGAIMSTLKFLRQKGHLVISASHEAVITMFKLTHMDKVLHIFDNETDAVAALSRLHEETTHEDGYN